AQLEDARLGCCGCRLGTGVIATSSLVQSGLILVEGGLQVGNELRLLLLRSSTGRFGRSRFLGGWRGFLGGRRGLLRRSGGRLGGRGSRLLFRDGFGFRGWRCGFFG